MSIISTYFVRKLASACRRRRKIDAIIMVGALATSGALLANTEEPNELAYQSLEAISETAENFVRSKLGSGATDTSIQAGTLDRRLRLADCDQSLQAFLRPGTQIKSRTTVGVRCKGSRPWKVYLPVDLIVSRAVLVPKRALRKGHLLTADDLVSDIRDVSRMHSGYFTDAADLTGQRVRHQLPAGRVLTPSMLEADKLIVRGQTVTLQVRTSGINISMKGKALNDGALNQRIRVQNSNSGRTVEGIVRSRQYVEILVAGSDRFFHQKPKVSVQTADTRLSNNDR